MKSTSFCLLAGLIMLGASARAQEASQVFDKVQHAIYLVIVTSADLGVVDVVGSGSAVLVAPGRLVTNCHVARVGPNIFVTRSKEKVSARARVVHAAPDFDLCELDLVEPAPGFDRPVEIGNPDAAKVGDPVYAIGAPRGMELTMSSGIISAMRQERKAQVIQITAPISHGSSGGGLFDKDGRLVGITTAGITSGQNLNFAVSVKHLHSAGLTAADLQAERAQFTIDAREETAFERRERLRRQEESTIAARRKQLDAEVAAESAARQDTPAAPTPASTERAKPAAPVTSADIATLLLPFENAGHPAPRRMYEKLQKSGALAGLGGIDIANRVYMALIAEQVGAELRWRGSGKPVAELQVQLRRNGEVMYLLPGKSSGIESFDREAQRAVGAASPFLVPQDDAAFESLRNFTLVVTAPKK